MLPRVGRRGCRQARVAALVVALSMTSGCYYGHLASGQLRVLWGRMPLAQAAAAPDTPPELAHRLALVNGVRAFARELGLDVGDQYTAYVPWPGDRIVTTVVTTRAREVSPAGFDFPIIGELPYKGFFDRERAEKEAERLRAESLDVCLIPVSAYSTLGWLDDPVTGPMIRRARSDGEFVETLLHELVHATAFWSDDPDFSESVASFVGQEAVIRYAAEHGARDPGFRGSAAGEWQRVEEQRVIGGALLRFRARVADLYAGEPRPDDAERRAVMEADARRQLAGLPLHHRDPADFAERVRLGDACLAIRGTYASDIPLHAARLDRLGGNLKAFVARLREAAGSDPPRDSFFAEPHP